MDEEEILKGWNTDDTDWTDIHGFFLCIIASRKSATTVSFTLRALRRCVR